jgi:hypothetical protein
MRYCLVKDGKIIKFNIDKPKVVLGNRNNEEYYELIKNKPTFDHKRQQLHQLEPKIRDNKVIIDYTLVDIPNEIIKNERFTKLEEIFTDKVLGLKKLAINKPFMTNKEAINDQYRVYEEMYKNAKAGFYSSEINLSIITQNEKAKKLVAPVILLVNEARSLLQELIEKDDESVDELLKTAEQISLNQEDLTPNKLAEIKTILGLS